jgi:Prokaryotic RING finger family 1
MPHVFYKDNDKWRVAPVVSPGLLRLDPVGVEATAVPGLRSPAKACLFVYIATQNKWGVMVGADMAVRHNGVPIKAGLRMLEHRDALAPEAGTLLFFSTEELARVEPFAGAAAVACQRCRGEIRQEDAAVRCPSCGVVHHEAADRNCWTYAETCAMCPQPSAPDAGLSWSPEEL